MKKEFSLNYGAMADSLENQCNNQGYTLGKNIKKLTDLHRSMLMVYLHGLVTDYEKKK